MIDSSPSVLRTRLRTLISGLCLLLGATAAVAQDPAAERLLREAQRLETNDPGAALEEYRVLVEQFPADRAAPEALLRMVQLYRDQRDARRASQALDQLLDGYGRSPAAATGFLIRGEILRSIARTAQELEEARSELRRVPLLFGRETYPGLEARIEARLLAGEVSRMLGDDERAAADFLLVIEDEPPSPASARARRLLAELLVDRGEWQAAGEILQRLLDGAGETDGESAPVVEHGDNEAGLARQLLTLLHRRLVRPLAGQPYWRSSSSFGQGLQLKSPSGVAAHPDGRLLVTDEGLPLIAILSATGEIEVRSAIRGLSRPYWDGDLASAVAGEALAQPFGGQPSKLKAPGKDGALKGMVAVERGSLGDRYVVARSQTGVLRYSNTRRSTELLATAKPDFVDLARDGRDRIYALDKKGGKIERIGLDRRPEGIVLRDDWKRAEALAVDRLGYVFVLDRGNRQVSMYDPDGKKVEILGPRFDGGIELRAPVDVAVDGGGRLFIADAKLPFLVVVE